MQHMLIGRPFSYLVWHDVYSALRLTTNMLLSDETFFDWWHSSIVAAPASLHKGTTSLWIIVVWSLWKRIFDNAQPSTTTVTQAALAEAKMWALAGAKGLRVFIFDPT